MADNPLLPKVTQPGPMASGGNKTQLDPGWMTRVAKGLADLFRRAPQAAPGDAAPANAVVRTPTGQTPGASDTIWMGPGRAINPVVNNPWDVAGREDTYPVGYNINTTPRQFEGPSFDLLEALAENLDILKLAIETRKDQMGNLTGSFKPRKLPGQPMRPKPDDRCAALDDFMRRPDGRMGFRSWMRELVHEQLVYDAPAIYVRRTIGGDVYRLEVMRGKTIIPKIDGTGRMPDAPEVAYQQINNGVPTINYNADELIYWPRNRRAGRRYGFSPVQQVEMTVNIAMRREVAKLNYFTEGNIPEAMCSVPETWSAQQIAQFQVMWDALHADQRTRSKMKFVPGGTNYQVTRSDAALMGPVDEWLARVVCYAFSLPPLPFVQQMNRATAETSYESALSEGLQPMMLWAKDLLDHIAQSSAGFGYGDIEWIWDEIDDVEPQNQDEIDMALVKTGMKSIDEYRIARGEDPIGMGPAIFGIGPLGIMFVDTLLKAKEQGLDMPQAPPPPDAMGGFGGMGGGMPAQPFGAPPQLPAPANINGAIQRGAAATVANIDPSILESVGLGRGGPAGRRIDVTAKDALDSDPMARSVFHPNVLRTLREVERKQGRGAAR